MSTLFTKIINGEIPAQIIYEDDKVIAINDISPQTPIHKLIIPRQEIHTLNDLSINDQPLIGHMIYVAKQLAMQLKIAENGYRLVFNCNQDGGQTVNHIHLHLLGGRSLGWPPG